MPAAIVNAIAEIKREIMPAKRTEQGEDEGRQYSYASVDDIYLAVQREMGKRGLILEMLDGGHDSDSLVAIGDKVGFWLKLIPTFTLLAPQKEGEAGARLEGAAIVARYSNPIAVIHAVAILENGNSLLAARTNAERNYLRNLLKLPTIGAGADGIAEAPPAGATPAAGIGAVEPTERRTPRKPGNPIELSAADSEAERSAYLADLEKCTTAAEVDTLFKKLGSKFARLAPHDQQLIRAKTKQTNERLAAA